MRKFLFTLAFALMVMVTFAQDEHMTFKGIPLQGSLNAFVQKLKGKGFTPMETTTEDATLIGKFASYDDCFVFVYAEKGNVSSVMVMFPEQKTWNAITNRYYSLVGMLTEKYGTPETVERFSDGEPGSDYLRFHALLNGECIYISKFKTQNGSIKIAMIGTDYNAASVTIKYSDDKNEEAERKSMMDDL